LTRDIAEHLLNLSVHIAKDEATSESTDETPDAGNQA
jgi:hypothetical protein